jgi:hypothetical protein
MTSELIGRTQKEVTRSHPELARAEFGRLCRLIIDSVEDGLLSVPEGVYRVLAVGSRIPGPLSPAEQHLFTIARNLELPPVQRDPSLPRWEGFRKKFEELFPRE